MKEAISRLKNKQILVTGGAGFIGSNLCEFLLEQGVRVTCLDNLSTGYSKNLAYAQSFDQFNFIEGDIRDLGTCKAAVQGVDIISHQAALGSVPRSIKDPVTTNAVNVGGFLNMLTAAKDAGISRFVYAASSSTYGDSDKLPKVESVIGKPLSPYAITKYVNELYADVFANSYGIEPIGLRYFNVFGRKQTTEGAYAAVIPKFVKSFIDKQSPVINGDGSYSRDFTYIDNVIQANVLALASDNSKAVNEVYNIAFGKRIDLITLATLSKTLLEQYDSEIAGVPLQFGEFRAGDIPHSLADISKAKELLGYDPSHSVEDGLREAIDWYWKHL